MHNQIWVARINNVSLSVYGFLFKGMEIGGKHWSTNAKFLASIPPGIKSSLPN